MIVTCPACLTGVGHHEPGCLYNYVRGGGVVENLQLAEAMGFPALKHDSNEDGHDQHGGGSAAQPQSLLTVRQHLKDQVWMLVAQAISVLSTCPKRRVGCVLIDKHGYVLSTGFNGVSRGRQHCTEASCPGVGSQSGQSLYTCEAVHAEANALLQCRDTQLIHTVYCTDSPCHICVNMLLNTSAVRLVFAREYPHPYSRTLWTKAGRDWLQTGDTAK